VKKGKNCLRKNSLSKFIKKGKKEDRGSKNKAKKISVLIDKRKRKEIKKKPYKK